MKTVIETLERKLREWRLAKAGQHDTEARDKSNQIYKILFSNDLFLNLWDERTILGIGQLLDSQPPSESLFRSQIQALRERRDRVVNVNDLFYQILSPALGTDAFIAPLKQVTDLSDAMVQRIHADNGLAFIRGDEGAPSVKIRKVLTRLTEELGVSFDYYTQDIESCLRALCERENIGVANALLVHSLPDLGFVLPISAQLKDGTGKAEFLMPVGEEFASAGTRARYALVTSRLLSSSRDVLLTGELTDAKYVGSSIALAAAMAAFSSAREVHLDPYTAFTGDIRPQGQNWVIRSVSGIPVKLQAAIESGVRRVFLPQDNEHDVSQPLRERLTLVFVRDLKDVLDALLFPAVPMAGDTLQEKKISILKGECADQGWPLSPPAIIQGGLQFTISPARPPILKVNIYNTGSHTPKQAPDARFQHLFELLNSLDAQPIPLSSIQQVIIVKDPALRIRIQAALEELGPVSRLAEQYCQYSFEYRDGSQRLVVKQYTSGKLQLQGYAGDLLKRVLDVIIHKYNATYPNAALNVEDYIATSRGVKPSDHQARTTRSSDRPDVEEQIPLPYIGTDESGKGDYFGPLVVAGVWLDEATQRKLETLGVRDSKLLTDQKCRQLAAKIRDLCRDKYHVVEIAPEKYNSLYEQFVRERKNLNHLLAWGHARVIEDLLVRHQSLYAVADQFGDEQYIRSKLMEKGRTIQLLQTPKAERHLAVAAASILARDHFLSRLLQLGQQLDVLLPKGVSPNVVEAAQSIVRRAGLQALSKVAKLHFKTTSMVLEKHVR